MLVAFEMEHASDFQRHFPRAGRAPELEQDARPAFVLVFDGPVELPTTGGPRFGVRLPLTGVVCVLVGDTPNFYSGIDLNGFRP